MKFVYLIATLFVIVGCKSTKKVEPPIPEIKVVTATETMVPNTFEFITQTKATRSYLIQPRVNGYLKTTNFSNGMPVKKGQVLFTIDSAPFQTQVLQAKASVASAKASLAQAEANYNRSVPLAKMNAISKSQLDGATAEFLAAKEQVTSSQALLENALINLSYCTIIAPESGIIAPSAANSGDYVGAGTAYQTLTTISFDDSVSVNISLPTTEYYKVVDKQKPSYLSDSLLHDITLKLSDGTIYPYKGVYRYTMPLVDSQTGSIVFNVRFPNKEGLLKGGQFARVTASLGDAQLRILIPARSVNEIQGIYSTYVVGKDDVLEFRKITLGDVVGNQWVVLDGVKAGERVITEGFLKVREGMKIKPVDI